MRVNRLGVMCAAVAASCAFSTGVQADARVAWMELEGPLAERPGPFDWLMGSGATTLSDMIGLLDEVAFDDNVDGLVLRLSNPAWNAAQIEEVGDAIGRVRDAGKKVYAFSDMYEAGELRIASYADEVLMQTGGAVFFPGVYMEEMFLADTLALVGAKADYVQIGKYKGAEEQMMNAEPSEAWDQNISQLLDSMYESMRSEIKANRGLSDAQLDRAMETAWYADGKTAEKAGLIDGEIDRDRLTDHLRAALDDDIIKYTTRYDPSRGGASMDMSNPFALLQMLSTEPKNETERDTIAVVHIDGAIMDGESTPATAFGGSTVGAVTIRETLKEIADDDLVRGVIVRINSPGGSAIASENIWQGVRNLAETKPVWVSVGSMAASGGYYIAVAGDKIYSSKSGIVGSIGVVGGKIALGGVYDKVGVNVVGRSRGPNAAMFATDKVWTDPQRDLVREPHDRDVRPLYRARDAGAARDRSFKDRRGASVYW